LFGTVGQANYGAAKAGIVSLTTITATGAGGQAAGASPPGAVTDDLLLARGAPTASCSMTFR